MKEELKEGISNYLKRFNKYSKEEYIDLEYKRVNKDKSKNAELFKKKLAEQKLCCYYCNNDKSNTIEPEIFKEFFGKQKSVSYKYLMEEKNIKSDVLYWHYL